MDRDRLAMDREARRGMLLVFVPGFAFVLVLTLILSRIGGREPFEPGQFHGCYSADDLRVELSANFIRLPGSPEPLPAQILRDKNGPVVLVQRPVRYTRSARGELTLVSYRGSGTLFRLRDGAQPAIELSTDYGMGPSLTKVDCQ